MLPYTPLQWLLFHEAAGRPSGQGWMADEHPLVLVMTSANPGGEPIVRDDGEALARLGGIADALLLHDRAIVTRCDDSVVRVARDLPRDGARNETRDGSRSGAGNETCDGPRIRSAEAMREPAREGAHPVDAAAPVARFIRRARGFTPQPIRLPAPGPSVLATGGFLKNTVCLTRGDEAFLSQHIGDLDNAPTCAMLDETVARLCDLLRIEPDVVAHDLHPDFYSTRFAAAYAGARGLPAIAVQHHHAHVASVVAEHRRRGPVLGLALDGVGLGADGTAWGGELLRVDGHRCERLGHLAPLALPGGDRAAREPWRMAAAALHRIGRRDEIAGRFPGRSGDALATMLDRGVGCPPTTSLGRWFDATVGLLRVREVSAFEGQAAMLLEGLAAAHGPVSGLAAGYAIAGGVLDFSPLVACIADLAQRTAVERYLAALFHATVADGLVAWVREAAAREGLDTVALGGGCMMNDVLSTALVGGLRRAGVTPLVACSAPPNDGGLALGQAWVAVETALAGDPR
jgi:hydrogenase maturation protein HypF